MKKLEKRINYINTATGEAYEKSIFVDMQFDEEEGYLFWNQKASIKTFLDRKLPDEFSWAEKGRIDELRHYMMKDSQLLVYRSGSCIKPIGISELCNILNMSTRQSRALVKKMKDNGIIKEVKTDGNVYYAFNPIYGLKSKRVTLIMFLWFQDEFKKVMPEWVIKKFIEQANELKPDIQIIK